MTIDKNWRFTSSFKPKPLTEEEMEDKTVRWYKSLLDKFATRTCLFTVLQRIRVTPTSSYNYNLEATIILAMYLGANWTRPSLSLASLTFALVFLLVSLALLFLAHFPCHMHTGQRLGQHVNYFSSCIICSNCKQWSIGETILRT